MAESPVQFPLWVLGMTDKNIFLFPPLFYNGYMDLKSMPKNRLVLIGVAGVVVLGVILAIFFGRRTTTIANPVTLTAWGTEPKAAFDALAAGYSALRPNVTIHYSQIGEADYDTVLLNAFVAGQGPDLLMSNSHDVARRVSVLAAATSTQFVPSQLDSLYPSVVRDDVVVGNQLYAMPLSMDTLALVYNRDLLDQAGIPTPPQTWQDLLNDIPKLRKTNAQGQLLQAAIPLGGTETTVPHAADIVSLLMLQNGTAMTSPDGSQATFADSRSSALQAFQFYLDFANPSSNAYTWNESQGNGLESFLAGKTAMLFVYQKDLATIKARSPFLNIALAPMLQAPSGAPVNYASYPTLAVWKRGHAVGWAWDFAIFAATNPAANTAYLNLSGTAPVLRTLTANLRGGDITIFAQQGLTARTWQVADYGKMKAIFSNAISISVSGQSTVPTALQAAQDQINNIGTSLH
jgi:multiple sugar transport system substrate-binding protein